MGIGNENRVAIIDILKYWRIEVGHRSVWNYTDYHKDEYIALFIYGVNWIPLTSTGENKKRDFLNMLLNFTEWYCDLRNC